MNVVLESQGAAAGQVLLMQSQARDVCWRCWVARQQLLAFCGAGHGWFSVQGLILACMAWPVLHMFFFVYQIQMDFGQ